MVYFDTTSICCILNIYFKELKVKKCRENDTRNSTSLLEVKSYRFWVNHQRLTCLCLVLIWGMFLDSSEQGWAKSI